MIKTYDKKLTVGELIDLLEYFNPKLPVYSEYDGCEHHGVNVEWASKSTSEDDDDLPERVIIG